jgi:5-methylcytosine-specific restriction endonuclease McrBC regulatory subunit McrC
VAGSAVLQSETRRRAAGLRRYLEDVGEMHPGDERVQLDRRTAYYRDALTLGRHILSSTGRSLDVGTQAVWTFLFRTPLLVERGIREVLRRRFGPQNVSKRKRRLGSSSLTLNPDLTIGHPRTSAVADVKYKVSTTEWKRNDLYQAVAFAVGFRVRNAAIIEFVMPDGQCLEPVSVGDIVVRHLCWPADPNVPAAIAADALATDFAKWLLSCRPARVTWTSEAARS